MSICPTGASPLAGHRQPLGELTRNALLAWLEYRRATWPGTANRHVLISRISALGTGPVAPDYLDKHQLCGLSLERIRRDRILQEALATGADRLHLTLVFNIDHTNAMAYANAARNLLSTPQPNRHRYLPPGRRSDCLHCRGIVTVTAVIVTAGTSPPDPACRLPAGYRLPVTGGGRQGGFND